MRPEGRWRHRIGVFTPQFVILAAARIHGGIGREVLGGTTDLVEMHLLHGLNPAVHHEQVDIHVDTRMREHDGVEGVVPSHYPPRPSKPETV